MKTDFHFHFYSRILIMAVLAVFLILSNQSVETQAGPIPPYDIKGWSWSDSVGWVSLNCNNDFETPGIFESHCGAQGFEDYGLELGDLSGGTVVTGCAWAGSHLNASGAPLGWICFSDPGSGLTEAPTFGIPLSATYINALSTTAYASIVSQQHYACSISGNSCSSINPCLGGEGTCNLVADDAWKLGFPVRDQVTSIGTGIGQDPNYPSINNPLSGCFNCYQSYSNYVCADDDSISCDGVCPVGQESCEESTGLICPQLTLTVYDTCEATILSHSCDNCLEYFYYRGACSNDQSSCSANDDCGGASDTCENLFTCDDNVELICRDSGGVYLNNCATEADCLEREIGSLKKVLGGYACSSCTVEDADNVCGLNSYVDNINRCSSCSQVFQTPGVMVDHRHYSVEPTDSAALCGWAWNDWGLDQGLGWFQFEPRVVTSTRPYISVEGGSIYSKGRLYSRYAPPFNKYSASYLIESNADITNFISGKTLEGEYQGEFPYSPSIDFFNFIESTGKYENALGSIDYKGLITKVGGTDYNKYESEVIEVANITELLGQLGGPLEGRVIRTAGDMFLFDVSPIEIMNGSGTGSGAGVIIVEGDLIIMTDIVYNDGDGFSNLKNIPSVVWLVKGDIYVSPDVSTIAGTFIVVGDDNVTSCGAPSSCDVTSITTGSDQGCGQFASCFDLSSVVGGTACDTNALTVNGSVISRLFELCRGYYDSSDPIPAEQFVNDGRLQANPPPGFTDFSKVLPRFY